MNSHSEDNTAWRRALRRDMTRRRAALAGAEHEALSARIVAHALAALPRPKVAAFCWPIKHEPDLRALLASWTSVQVRAVLPVVVAENAPLRFREWTPDSRLAPDRYGIPTPTAGGCGIHWYVYPGEPPVGETAAAPPHVPGQGESYFTSPASIGCSGSTVKVQTVSQPAASVMVTLHVPAHSPETALVPWPTGGLGDHA